MRDGIRSLLRPAVAWRDDPRRPAQLALLYLADEYALTDVMNGLYRAVDESPHHRARSRVRRTPLAPVATGDIRPARHRGYDSLAKPFKAGDSRHEGIVGMTPLLIGGAALRHPVLASRGAHAEAVSP